jgi:hypothetical protein
MIAHREIIHWGALPRHLLRLFGCLRCRQIGSAWLEFDNDGLSAVSATQLYDPFDSCVE